MAVMDISSSGQDQVTKTECCFIRDRTVKTLAIPLLVHKRAKKDF